MEFNGSTPGTNLIIRPPPPAPLASSLQFSISHLAKNFATSNCLSIVLIVFKFIMFHKKLYNIRMGSITGSGMRLTKLSLRFNDNKDTNDELELRIIEARCKVSGCGFDNGNDSISFKISRNNGGPCCGRFINVTRYFENVTINRNSTQSTLKRVYNLPVSKQPAFKQLKPWAAITPAVGKPHFKCTSKAKSQRSACNRESANLRKFKGSRGIKDSQPFCTTDIIISECSSIVSTSAGAPRTLR
uniref:Uncharacterized protein n=1 Tax=Glossina austeni TaxID=7395 RepID=A0A1A9VCV4_GLOAU